MQPSAFTIPDYPTLIWRIVKPLNIGGWPSWLGVTIDGRRYTVEREVDVAFCCEIERKECVM